MTWLRFAASTLDITGTLMISFVLLSVHEKFKQEREIDQAVIDEMNNEQIVVLIALILISLSWALIVIAEFQDVYKKKRRESFEKIVLDKHPR
jgi:hypothetical protein